MTGRPWTLPAAAPVEQLRWESVGEKLQVRSTGGARGGKRPVGPKAVRIQAKAVSQTLSGAAAWATRRQPCESLPRVVQTSLACTDSATSS